MKLKKDTLYIAKINNIGLLKENYVEKYFCYKIYVDDEEQGTTLWEDKRHYGIHNEVIYKSEVEQKYYTLKEIDVKDCEKELELVNSTDWATHRMGVILLAKKYNLIDEE